MLVYSHIITPRLQYIIDFIGRELLDESIQITTDAVQFEQTDDTRINYSNTTICKDEVCIKPQGLLFSNTIEPITVKCNSANNGVIFFANDHGYHFDIFSAVFYLISRYEEYLPHQKDMYGRYAHENSLAYKENFLDLPLVDSWIKEFRNVLKEKFPGIRLKEREFEFLPTYDIDEAFSFKHKTNARSLGGLAKNVLNGQWGIAKERQQVLKGKSRDPYDSFEWMNELHNNYNLHPQYFFLVAGNNGKYDKNILPTELVMEELIKDHDQKYPIGVHPSWQSGDDKQRLVTEIKTLEKITGKKIDTSRQHFIRMTLPETYRDLINNGIKKDFSMGYGSINGFRASVSRPFFWYDLKNEKTTDLLIYPFCFMDANAFFEEKLTSIQAMTSMMKYYQSLHDVDGMFTSIWHNTFLGTAKLFAGWREVYAQFIQHINH